MITYRRTMSPRVHVPLRRTALCLDCDECFEIGSHTCPACGSTTWTSLSGFLEDASSWRQARPLHGRPAEVRSHDDQRRIARQLVVVADNRASLHEYLKQAFAGNETIRVVLNRRVMQRRQLYGPYDSDRRRDDRRSPLKVDGLLRTIGWAVLRLEAPATPRASAR
jgi:hypothetical protein